MKGRPLFIPLVSIIAGILLAGLYLVFVPHLVLLPLLLLSFIAIFLPSRLTFLLVISLLFFCWGNLSLKDLLQADLPPNHVSRFAAGGPVTLEGVVDSRPELKENGARLYIACERLYQADRVVPVCGRVLVSVGESRCNVAVGDRIRLVSRLHRPRNYGLPGEYDYVRHLALKGIFVTAFAPGADDLVLIMTRVSHLLQRSIDDVAGEMGEFISKALPPVEGGILRALLLGDRGHVPHYLETAYASTGVNHILSISGFHVGIIALFVFQLLFGICRNFSFLSLQFNLRKSLLIITLPLIVFYLVLSGAAPATARSVIMLAAWVLALVVEREVEPVNSLLVAAAVILAIAPGALFDISFQLSFIALWGIVVLTPIFMLPFARLVDRKLLNKILLFLMASLAAIIVTILPVAAYFHRVSFTGLISNLVVVPLMGYGAVVLGFTALPFIFVFPGFAKLLLSAAAFMVKVSNGFILLLSQIPAVPLFNPDRLDLLLFFLLLLVLTFVASRNIKIVSSIIFILAFAGNGLISQRTNSGRLQIHFLSVGQGESTLLKFPDGKTMLVDGGGSARQGGASVGERLLAPALWSMGVTAIDYLVLTHSHPDHLQGLLYIAETFHVGEFWESSYAVDNCQDYQNLKAILKRRNIRVREVGAVALPVTIAGATIDFLWPRSEAPEDPDLNGRSLVFRVGYGKGTVLFTGDIGAEVEKQLLSECKDLHCNVLKVPHHGSRYSSSPVFLQLVAPEIALISAGYDNSFHLPAQSTLSRLQHHHADIYRTDLDGTISLVYDDASGKFVVQRQSWHFN